MNRVVVRDVMGAILLLSVVNRGGLEVSLVACVTGR